MWVLTIGVLEVNPQWDSIRAQRGRARSALFSRVLIIVNLLLLLGKPNSSLFSGNIVTHLTLVISGVVWG